MSRLPICLVGCGGMGSRHVNGYAALDRTGLGNVELVAVCDRTEAKAQRVAGEVEAALGYRPKVLTSFDAALADPAIGAFDVVTQVSTHVEVALPALQAGKHVLCEKPLALTVRACRALIDAAETAGSVLAVAENYRRDPPNRLARAVLDAGLIGHPHMLMQMLIGGHDRIIITPWRHLKDKGAIGLDLGCHLTDLAQYYLGGFESVSGLGMIAEPVRYRRDAPEMDLPAYRERFAQMPQSVVPTGEDTLIGTYHMRSGALAEIIYLPSGPGHAYSQRTLHGRAGSLEIFEDRRGRPPVLRRAQGELVGDQILAELPDYHLDEITSRLFGERATGYTLPFAEADAALMAIEIHDFGDAVLHGRKPEIDGLEGTMAVAAVLGAYESGLTGRSVTMEELLAGTVSSYQDEIDRALGLAG